MTSSIYTSAPTQTDVYPVGAQPLQETVNWQAVQVIVDNPTNQWLYLPAAKRYIAPGVMGAIVPFSGSTAVQAQWQAPAGYTQPGTIAGQQATLVWLSPSITAAPDSGVATTPIVDINGASVTISGPVDVTPAAGSTFDVTGDVTVAGSVDVASGTVEISGTPDVNVTNASIPVSGSVDATITGPVSIATGQVVDVQNAAGGSLTVAGTVDIGGTPSVAISGTPDVNITNASVPISGSVDISSGSLDAVITGGTVDITVPSGQSIEVINEPGNNLLTNVAQAITSIGNASGPVTNQNVVLPTGVHFVCLTIPSGLSIPSFEVKGHVTGADYTGMLNAGVFLNYPSQWLIIDPVDTSIDVSLGATPVTTLYIGGSVSPAAVALNVNEDVFAQLVDSAGTNLGSFTYPPGGLDDSQKILATGLPEPMAWMRPSSIFRINASMSSLSTLALVTPPAGEKIYLHQLQLDIDTVASSASELQLQDTAGNVLASFSTAFQHDIPADLGGIAPLAAGVGVQLHNASTATIIIRGFLTYAEQ